MRHGDPVPANTGNELLRIEVDLPRERMEMFFRLEADRMVNAVLRGWEAQRFTVLEQFFVLQRNETGRFQEALNGVTGLAHPIYIHTGGHERDHAYWNRASMLRMYDEYIVPNNATLTLIGDMTVEEARALGTTYFGRVPRAPAPPAEHGCRGGAASGRQCPARLARADRADAAHPLSHPGRRSSRPAGLRRRRTAAARRRWPAGRVRTGPPRRWRLVDGDVRLAGQRVQRRIAEHA